jgi:hypothetical protein
MAEREYPDHLHVGRHRDLHGRGHQPWVRRVVISLFAALLVAALFNVFGQRSESARAAGSGANLEVRGPTKVRGGLLFQQRITVEATRDIEFPRIVLGTGFADGLQLNTLEPQPQSESSRDGKIVLSYDSLSRGDKLEIWIQYQANPTHVGDTDMSVEVDDRTTPLVTISRTLTTFP